ncbi:MAG: chromosome segregation protein SMC [Pseudomonadota bacterium]
MKIKKISLIGFKSFMDRLDIPLPEGISAIVGPNGCGKSNIVDAIRWVMGEQSAKQLRGRQMDDVIFNGAGESKPFGMAEVSMILENGDGSFPTEFAQYTELSVTRRLYRSGESEYLINNVPCRLKDIQEIFMDTGLGNRAYSLIGQGQIGSIIDQKPEETRGMLEEAAGITKYRKKVEESRRKIELTRANLQRIEDIMVEVQKQMRSMERQAAKARRFKSVAQEIQRLELILNANFYRELEMETVDKVKSTEALLQEEMARTAEFSALQARIEAMKMEMEDKDGTISGLRGAYLRLKDRVNKKESGLDSLGGEKRMQKELEGRLQKDREDLTRRLGGLKEEKEALREKIEGLKKGYALLEEEISLLDTRTKSKATLLKEAREEYERAKEKLNSRMTKEIGLNQESGYLNKRILEVTDAQERLEREKGEVVKKIEKVLEVSEIKNQTREALAQKLMAIQQDISREKERYDELERLKKKIEMDLKLAEADMNIYHSRLASLRSLTENFEGYKLGVRTIMKAQDLEARRDGRIIGLVADVLQVEPKFEQALEAVLGDKLQYVIVERQKDGKEAVDYLKIKAKGRCSFIPLADLHGMEKADFRHNGHPLLREVVSVSDSYKTLVNTLLGDAALVPDLDQAISEWGRNGKDQCLVTMDGDMVDRDGVITGGKLVHSSHGILARKREIRELEERFAQCKKAVEGHTGKLEGTTLELEKESDNMMQLTEEKTRCQEKLNDLDKVLFQLGHELDQLERLSERISAELEQKGKEQSRHKEALIRVETELTRDKEKMGQEKHTLFEKETELKEIEKEYEEFRNEASSLKMDYNLAREEERGLSREIGRIDDFSKEAQEKTKTIEEELLTGQERYQEYLKREEALRGELEIVHGQLREAEETLSVAEHDRNQFLNDIKEQEKRGGNAREELEGLRERINRAKLEQSEIRFRMNGLLELVKEKFNLNLTDVYKDYLKDDFSPTEIRGRSEHLAKLKDRLGEVNLTAIQEHEALKERYTFIAEQREDLIHSMDSLEKAIRKINKISIERFMETFNAVDKKLKVVFPILFNGGTAGLKLVDEEKPLESGVLVEVRPPGKRVSHMGLLSGGEKALVAMALLFAIYLIKPSPFCILDEVDAPLDEANIDRFNDLLKEIRKYSQIILVTHNRRSMEIVDRLFGVTMEKAGISRIVSVNLEGFERN